MVRQKMPSLDELGRDLLHVSIGQKFVSLAMPFLLLGVYFVLFEAGFWWLALGCPVAISFFTYGSVSHDLVHRNLRLSPWLNEVLLSLLELLALRSGHAYRAAHLNHHAHFPDDDDIEAAAAKLPVWRALWNGMTLQPRIWFWSLGRSGAHRRWAIFEGFAVLILLVAALAFIPLTISPILYAVLMIVGSWIFPIVTTVIPHDPKGDCELTRTRLFRGRVLSWLALEHLYHLEHHLYPQVPHQNWPELARRLDPYFERQGLVPIKLFF